MFFSFPFCGSNGKKPFRSRRNVFGTPDGFPDTESPKLKQTAISERRLKNVGGKRTPKSEDCNAKFIHSSEEDDSRGFVHRAFESAYEFDGMYTSSE